MNLSERFRSLAVVGILFHTIVSQSSLSNIPVLFAKEYEREIRALRGQVDQHDGNDEVSYWHLAHILKSVSVVNKPQ